MKTETWLLAQDGEHPVLMIGGSSESGAFDLRCDVKPGRTVFGLAYDEWKGLEAGTVVFEVDDAGKRTPVKLPRRSEGKPLRKVKERPEG